MPYPFQEGFKRLTFNIEDKMHLKQVLGIREKTCFLTGLYLTFLNFVSKALWNP